jgi:hypothetical protein
MTVDLARLLLSRSLAILAVYLLAQKARFSFDWWRHSKVWREVGKP